MHLQYIVMCSLIFVHSFVQTHNLSRKKRSGDLFKTGFPFNIQNFQRKSDTYPFPYLYPIYPKFAQPLFSPPSVVPYPPIYRRRDEDEEETAPIIIPAGAAAAISIASLLHALISRKDEDPPYIPIPVTQTIPVPSPLRVPVPLPINKYIPIGVSSSQRHPHHNNEYDVQIHEIDPNSHHYHELEKNAYWHSVEKPNEIEHISLVSTSAPPIYYNNILPEKNHFEENKWKRKLYLKQKQKQRAPRIQGF